MSTNPIKQAAQITKAYAEDWDGLTREECKEAGFSDVQCNVLVPALGKKVKGKITADEQKKLEDAGFAKDFIKNLAGDDGNKALQSRVKWLADRINPKMDLGICQTNCDANERFDGVIELEWIGPAAAPAVPALIVALKDENWGVRSPAAWALGKIGPAAAPAIPALIAALKDENRNVGVSAAWALEQIGPAAIPALIAALKDKNSVLLYEAAYLLGKIGPAAVPPLIAALKDEDRNVRYCATLALGKIGDHLAIPPLQKMIREDPDLLCRQAAQESFDKLMEKFR